MHAHDIMSRHVVTIDADASIFDAIKIMLSRHIGGLPVVNVRGKLVGIVSEGDFVRRPELGTAKRQSRWLANFVGPERTAGDFVRKNGRKVCEIMSPNPITIDEDMPLDQIALLMERHNVERLPVMRGDRIVGMVTPKDFLIAIANRSLVTAACSCNDEQIRESVIATLSRAPWRPCGLNVSVRDRNVTLRGAIRGDKARKAIIVTTQNVAGVERVIDGLCKISQPPPEEDYGGGDFASLEYEPSTDDDTPL